MSASDKPRFIRVNKVFTFGNTLHFTLLKQAKSFGLVKCKIYLRFLLPLPQAAVAEYITQVLGGDNRR